jgi:hypothetical protein
MRNSLSSRAASAAAASLAGLAALAPSAAADAVYHTQHMELDAIAGAPLRSGFVQDSNLRPSVP